MFSFLWFFLFISSNVCGMQFDHAYLDDYKTGIETMVSIGKLIDYDDQNDALRIYRLEDQRLKDGCTDPHNLFDKDSYARINCLLKEVEKKSQYQKELESLVEAAKLVRVLYRQMDEYREKKFSNLSGVTAFLECVKENNAREKEIMSSREYKNMKEKVENYKTVVKNVLMELLKKEGIAFNDNPTNSPYSHKIFLELNHSLSENARKFLIPGSFLICYFEFLAEKTIEKKS